MIASFHDQVFHSHDDWVARAKRVLTCHPDYLNAEHLTGIGDRGWRGPHFTAMCFDQAGRRMRTGGDFARAEYPVYWVWPDQVHALVLGSTGAGPRA